MRILVLLCSLLATVVWTVPYASNLTLYLDKQVHVA